MIASKIPRGRPAFATTQRDEILRMLRAEGKNGVSRHTLIYEKHISQCGARIDELKRAGYAIHSELRNGENYVRYVLDAEPLKVKPLQDGADWYESQTGKPRPSATDESSCHLPLFEGLAPR